MPVRHRRIALALTTWPGRYTGRSVKTWATSSRARVGLQAIRRRRARHRLIAAAGHGDQVVRRDVTERQHREPTRVGRRGAEHDLVGDRRHRASGHGLALRAIDQVREHRAWRDLGDERDVGDHEDRVGELRAGDGLDEVDAGLLHLDRDAAHVGVSQPGQDLAPRGDDLLVVEQRHLCVGGETELHATLHGGLVGTGAALRAILAS